MNGLKHINFAGGEPTINKHHMKVLDRIIKLDKASQIELKYSSNMVAIPPKLLQQWKHFLRIQIGASIDAVGPLAHYVRHPSNWKTIEKNLDQIGYGQIPQLYSDFATTISILNIRHFIELSQWLVAKFYTNINRYPAWHVVRDPDYYSIQCLPLSTKLIIEQEFETFYQWIEKNFGIVEAKIVRANYSGIIRFMNAKSYEERLPALKTITDKLDTIRNERLADHLPWLADILENL